MPGGTVHLFNCHADWFEIWCSCVCPITRENMWWCLTFLQFPNASIGCSTIDFWPRKTNAQNMYYSIQKNQIERVRKINRRTICDWAVSNVEWHSVAIKYTCFCCCFGWALKNWVKYQKTKYSRSQNVLFYLNEYIPYISNSLARMQLHLWN